MGRSDTGDGELLAWRGDSRPVFRIVKVLNPTEDDFRSNYERGLRPRHAEIGSALDHMSLSTWADAGQAIALSEQFQRRPGNFIAILELLPEEGIWLAETGPEGHIAVWGRREALLRCVRRVHPF